ncbi:38031_t:CDS:2, partial [Gigaspora margarita]
MFKNIRDFDKKKISFEIVNDKKFLFCYLKILYKNEPCSLEGFELYAKDDEDYKYPKINNKDGTESFLLQKNAKLYFKEDLLFEFVSNEYQIKEYLYSEGDSIYVYLTLNNEVVDLNKYVCKFINHEDYQKNDKSIDFNDDLFQIIEKINIDGLDIYELKEDMVGWCYFFYNDVVIKHIRVEYVLDFYNEEDNNQSAKFFSINKSIEFLFDENILEKPKKCFSCDAKLVIDTLNDESNKIGGKDVVVQINESKF